MYEQIVDQDAISNLDREEHKEKQEDELSSYQNQRQKDEELTTITIGDKAPQDACCRVCFDGHEEDNPLIEPCLCSGSMKYIHHTCMLHWLQVRYQLLHCDRRCEVCHYELDISIKDSFHQSFSSRMMMNVLFHFIQHSAKFLVSICIYSIILGWVTLAMNDDADRWRWLIYVQQYLHVDNRLLFFFYVGYVETMVVFGIGFVVSQLCKHNQQHPAFIDRPNERCISIERTKVYIYRFLWLSIGVGLSFVIGHIFLCLCFQESYRQSKYQVYALEFNKDDYICINSIPFERKHRAQNN